VHFLVRKRGRWTPELAAMVSAGTAGCDQCERHRVHVTVEEVCEHLRLTTAEAKPMHSD